ncbi:hypothetical protein [Alicyclobacillus vulcanalis]|uniref:DUF4129 domain-containing protein n=1 Tax=Alicyclobacillus vulcanalis TaxID=252246 RepID=A0A1N7PAQ1_9BACL|nr:hypothetical protein [Alicyclobacillus vulcanalis]SIT07715.1 hypothetical protein SAMN05421799_11265 [Alicyclobacillus vulcanalis]
MHKGEPETAHTERRYLRIQDAPRMFRALAGVTAGTMAAWLVASIFWSRSGAYEDLLWLTCASWIASTCVMALAQLPVARAVCVGALAGCAASAAVFLPLRHPGWLAAGVAASLLAAALSIPFLTYGDISLASRSLLRAATAVVIVAWIAYLTFVRPLSTPTEAGRALAALYPCAVLVGAAATARAAHRLTYRASAKRVWLAPIALALAFRHVPVQLAKALFRLATGVAFLVIFATALLAVLPRLHEPLAERNAAQAPHRAPFDLHVQAHPAHTPSGFPLWIAAALLAILLLLLLARMAQKLAQGNTAAETPDTLQPTISQRRLDDAFRLVPTSQPVRLRMQRRLRGWHRAGRTIALGTTVRSFVRALPDELREPGDLALLQAYERARYGPDDAEGAGES